MIEQALSDLPTGGKLFYEEDVDKAAEKIIGVINEKRKALNLK